MTLIYKKGSLAFLLISFLAVLFLIGLSGVAKAATEQEMEAFALVNNERVNAGIGPLGWNEELYQAAHQYAQHLLINQLFSHVGADGSVFTNRIEAAGYVRWAHLGENLAWGSGRYATPQQLVQGWMASESHRANILDPNFTQTGLSFALGSYFGKTGAALAVQEFGHVQ